VTADTVVTEDTPPEVAVAVAFARFDRAAAAHASTRPAAGDPETQSLLADLSAQRAVRRDGPFTCAHCKGVQKSAYGLTYHIRNRVCRGGLVGLDGQAQGPVYHCPWCNACLSSRAGVKSHVLGRTCLRRAERHALAPQGGIRGMRPLGAPDAAPLAAIEEADAADAVLTGAGRPERLGPARARGGPRGGRGSRHLRLSRAAHYESEEGWAAASAAAAVDLSPRAPAAGAGWQRPPDAPALPGFSLPAPSLVPGEPSDEPTLEADPAQPVVLTRAVQAAAARAFANVLRRQGSAAPDSGTPPAGLAAALRLLPSHAAAYLSGAMQRLPPAEDAADESSLGAEGRAPVTASEAPPSPVSGGGAQAAPALSRGAAAGVLLDWRRDVLPSLLPAPEEASRAAYGVAPAGEGTCHASGLPYFASVRVPADPAAAVAARPTSGVTGAAVATASASPVFGLGEGAAAACAATGLRDGSEDADAAAQARRTAVAAAAVHAYGAALRSAGVEYAQPHAPAFECTAGPGPVWALDGTAEHPANYAATDTVAWLACSAHHPDRALHAVGDRLVGRNVIQIWSVPGAAAARSTSKAAAGAAAGGSSSSSSSSSSAMRPSAAAAEPVPPSGRVSELRLALVHDSDTLMDVAWCPQASPDAVPGLARPSTSTAEAGASMGARSAGVGALRPPLATGARPGTSARYRAEAGCGSPRSPQQRIVDPYGSVAGSLTARLGLLAALCGDGAVRLYAVPHPDSISLRSRAQPATGAAGAAATVPPPIALQLVPLATWTQTFRTAVCLRWCPHRAGALYLGCSDGSILTMDASHWMGTGAGGSEGMTEASGEPSRTDLGFVLSASPRGGAASVLDAHSFGAAAAAAPATHLLSLLRPVARWAPSTVLQFPVIAVMGQQAAAVRALAVSPVSPRILLSVHHDGFLRMWDTAAPSVPLLEVPLGYRAATAVDFTVDGSEVLIAAEDCEVRICDVQTGMTRSLVSAWVDSGSQRGLRAPAWDVRVLPLSAMRGPPPPAAAGGAAAASDGAPATHDLAADSGLLVACGDGGSALVPLLDAGTRQRIRAVRRRSEKLLAMARAAEGNAKRAVAQKAAAAPTAAAAAPSSSPGTAAASSLLSLLEDADAEPAGVSGGPQPPHVAPPPLQLDSALLPDPGTDIRMGGLQLTHPVPPLGPLLVTPDYHPAAATSVHAPRFAMHRVRAVDVGDTVSRRGVAVVAVGGGDGVLHVRVLDLHAEFEAQAFMRREMAALLRAERLRAGAPAGIALPRVFGGADR